MADSVCPRCGGYGMLRTKDAGGSDWGDPDMTTTCTACGGSGTIRSVEGLDLRRGLNGSIRRQSFIRRYSSIHCNRPENVAEHNYYCVAYACMIGRDIATYEYVNMGVLLEKALWHDLSESVTGDIIRSCKYE